MVCLMRQDSREGKLTITTLDKANFQSETFINFEGTNVKKLLSLMTYEILDGIFIYQKIRFRLVLLRVAIPRTTTTVYG